MTKKQNRKRYTKEFKNEAVKLVTEQGYSLSEAAKNLGVNDSMLRRWKTAIENINSNPKSESMESELKRLRAENKRLKMEREILKKAAAFFANEMS